MNDATCECFQFQRLRNLIMKRQNLCFVVFFQHANLLDLRPSCSLHQYTKRPARKLEKLSHLGNRPYSKKIARRWFLNISIFLGNEQNAPFKQHRLFDGTYRTRASRIQMNDHRRKHDHTAQRQHGNPFHPLHIGLLSLLQKRHCQKTVPGYT